MVKNITRVIIIFLLMIGAQLKAESAQRIFVQAGKAYTAGTIQKALDLYESISEKGPSVWCNIGCCFFSLQNYLQALVAFKRARSCAPYALLATIDHHITATYHKLGKDNSNKGVLAFFEPWAHWFPLYVYQLLFLLCWYAVWVIIMRRQKMKYVLFFVASLCLVFTLLGSILLVHYTACVPRGIVMKASQLCAGPHEQYDVLKELSLADEVCITDSRRGWYKVATQNQTGWVSADSIEPV